MGIDNLDPFFNIISNLGAVGLIFWLVWRATNTTIPRMVASFEESMKEARSDFSKMLREQREEHGRQLSVVETVECAEIKSRADFSSMLKEQREEHGQQLAVVEASSKSAREDFIAALHLQRVDLCAQLNEHRKLYEEQVKLCREHADRALATLKRIA